MALAPDSSRGKTTASIEEAEALGAELDLNVKRWRGDIVGALQFLLRHGATRPTDGSLERWYSCGECCSCCRLSAEASHALR